MTLDVAFDHLLESLLHIMPALRLGTFDLLLEHKD